MKHYLKLLVLVGISSLPHSISSEITTSVNKGLKVEGNANHLLPFLGPTLPTLGLILRLNIFLDQCAPPAPGVHCDCHEGFMCCGCWWEDNFHLGITCCQKVYNNHCCTHNGQPACCTSGSNGEEIVLEGSMTIRKAPWPYNLQ